MILLAAVKFDGGKSRSVTLVFISQSATEWKILPSSLNYSMSVLCGIEEESGISSYFTTLS